MSFLQKSSKSPHRPGRLADWVALCSLTLASALVVAAAAGRIEASEATSASLVDLNRASAAELAELPGIGEAKAAAIVAHRVESGAFRSLDDLEQVRGIGPALVGKLRPLVKLGGSVRTDGTSPGSVDASGSGAAPSKSRSRPAGAPTGKK